MKTVADQLRLGRTLRVIGFDDAPFEAVDGAPVPLSGIVCAGTRFEGMLWSTATRDGDDATAVMATMLLDSKFHAQVHLVLIDGLAIGGFNLVDLPTLAARVDRPCLAVMRKRPNLAAVRRALGRFDDAARRLALIDAAGPIHAAAPFWFQAAGIEPDVAATALSTLTDRGHVPEALRLAHLIGAAVVTGASGRRA